MTRSRLRQERRRAHNGKNWMMGRETKPEKQLPCVKGVTRLGQVLGNSGHGGDTMAIDKDLHHAFHRKLMGQEITEWLEAKGDQAESSIFIKRECPGATNEVRLSEQDLEERITAPMAQADGFLPDLA